MINSAVENKIKIRFILNPFSGIGKKNKLPRILNEELDKSRFEYDLCYTKGEGHAAQLAQEAVDQKFHAVVAIGGDGSINEIGSRLIGTDLCLGIIPGGSGNGIARSLGVELNTRKALARINCFDKALIDTGIIANKPFIGIAGLGFDALIGQRFQRRKLRGMLSYGYLIIKEWGSFSPFEFSIEGQVERKETFVLAFANTTQYGNNAVIAPLAEFQDGQLELVCISELKLRRIPEMVLRLFSKTLDQSAHVQTIGFKEVTVKHSANFAHVDGEPFEVGPEVSVKIRPKSLWVLK